MRMQIVPQKMTVSAKRFAVNRAYGFVSEMPDMNAGDPVNITIQEPEDITGYEPDITVLIQQDGIVEMDMVSAYPSELVSKYKPLEYTGTMVTVHCKECKLPWSPNGINNDGYCLYCQWGWNGHSINNA